MNIKYLSGLIAIHILHADSFFNLAFLRLKSKDTAPSYKNLIKERIPCNNLEIMKNDLANAFIEEGLISLKLGNYSNALTQFSTALIYNENMHEAYNGRGVALLELQNFQMALHAFSEAIRLEPDESTYYFNKAICYENLDQLEMAKNYYHQATLKNIGILETKDTSENINDVIVIDPTEQLNEFSVVKYSLEFANLDSLAECLSPDNKIDNENIFDYLSSSEFYDNLDNGADQLDILNKKFEEIYDEFLSYAMKNTKNITNSSESNTTSIYCNGHPLRLDIFRSNFTHNFFFYEELDNDTIGNSTIDDSSDIEAI
ncbi:MAG: tetratricopeptide repeat protein [Rickettsiaceae bacterium]|nr:tetratricopeptide repeat protein [Rickettsiaceae bacterium]